MKNKIIVQINGKERVGMSSMGMKIEDYLCYRIEKEVMNYEREI